MRSLTFFLTYLLTFFLTYLLTFFLPFFLTYLLTYLPIFFLTSFWHIFWHSFWHIFWHSFCHSFWHIFWHIFRYSFWHLSDISFDILSDISSDILSDISFDMLSDIFSDILSDISFDMLSDIFSDILSDISKPKPNIHSFTKKSSFANSIFTSHHATKVISMTTLCLSSVIALTASDRPAKRQLSPKMQNACTSTHTHHMHQTVPPKSSWVEEMQSWQWCRNYISWRVQTMKPDACHCGSSTTSV